MQIKLIRWAISNDAFEKKKRVGILNSGSAEALMNLSVHDFIGA